RVLKVFSAVSRVRNLQFGARRDGPLDTERELVGVGKPEIRINEIETTPHKGQQTLRRSLWCEHPRERIGDLVRYAGSVAVGRRAQSRRIAEAVGLLEVVIRIDVVASPPAADHGLGGKGVRKARARLPGGL